MAKFTKPSLYRSAVGNLGKQAKRTAARSLIGQVLQATTRPKSAAAPLQAVTANKLPHPAEIVKDLLGRDSSAALAAVAIQDLARSGYSGQAVWQKLLGALGPAGKLLGELIGPLQALRTVNKTTIGSSLRAAQELLEAWGFTVTAPRGPGQSPRPRKVEVKLEEPSELLSDVAPRPGRSRAAQPDVSRPKTGKAQFAGVSATKGPNAVPPAAGGSSGDSGGGQGGGGGNGKGGGGGEEQDWWEFHANSSNVYAYAYRKSTAKLFIRFWHFDGESRKAGPLYSYSNVPPHVFWAMHAAASKGRFVWDQIRIRGTVSGHQYDYQLIGVRDGYVPRKATLRPDGEYYVPRDFKARKAGWLRSKKPEVQVTKMVRVALTPRGPKR